MNEKFQDTILYKMIRPIITVFFLLLFRPKIIGKENITNDGALVLAGNHTHFLDCLLLISSTKRHIHFLAKNELWKGPKRILFAHLGLIPVNRKQKDHKSLEKAKKYLENGQIIGIFPEGTIEKEKGKLLPFKIGAVKMASDTNTKIVPFKIKGNYKLFSKELSVIFGDAIDIKKDDLELEKERLSTIISTL